MVLTPLLSLSPFIPFLLLLLSICLLDLSEKEISLLGL